MNVETLILRSLFGACVLVCGWMLVSMVTAKPASVLVAASHASTVAASAGSNGEAG